MNRAKVAVWNCASVDGRLSLGVNNLLLYGDSRWTEVAGDSTQVYRQIKDRYDPQALLEGSGSLVLEESIPESLPPLKADEVTVDEDYLPQEIVKVVNRRWLTVVDGRGRIRWLFKEYPGEEWIGWHILVLVAHSTPLEYLAYLRRERIPYLVCGDRRVDLALALEKMANLLEVSMVVSSAGGKLNGALLRAGLIDEINIDFFPALIGGQGVSALFDAPPLNMDEKPVKLELLDMHRDESGHVHLRYKVLN